MTKLPFVGYGERAPEIFILVHIDVYGPFDVQVRDGYQYFIILIDDYSQYGYIFFMRYKFEASEKFKKSKREVEKQTRKLLKIL